MDPTGHECLNGCRSRQTGAPLRCHGQALICSRCLGRLRTWLEALPLLRAALSSQVARGSLGTSERSGARPTKQAHAPLPIRVEVVSLLDQRGDESVSGRIHRWQAWVQAARGLSREPDLLQHLEWFAQHGEVRSLYREVRTMHRQLRYALGDRPPSAVGTCGAELDDGEICGGPLIPLAHAVGVRCKWCGDEWLEGDLRGLGRLLERRWIPVSVAAYVSQRPEATIRDWMRDLALPCLCDLGSRQILVDAVTLAVLNDRRRIRRRKIPRAS